MKNRWLKHAFDDKNDERVLEIRAEFGAAGYGMLWLFRTTLAENQGKISIARLAGLAVSMGVDMETLKAFLRRCTDVGITYVDSDNFIHCKLVDEQLKSIEETSVKAKEAIAKRWEKRVNNAENTVVLQPNYVGNTDKIREEKIREENTPRKRAPSRSAKGEFSQDALSVYEVYPLKEGRAVALASIEKALQQLRSNPSLIANFLADKKLSPEQLQHWSEPVTFLRMMIRRYIKNKPEWKAYAQPATWFNQERYFDDTPDTRSKEMEDLGITPRTYQ